MTDNSDEPSSPPENGPQRTIHHTVWVAGISIALAAAVVAFAALLILAVQVLFLMVLAILLGILLGRTTCIIRDKLGLPYRWSLALVVALLVTLFAGGAAVLGHRIMGQARRLADRLPRAADEIKKHLKDYPGVLSSVQKIPGVGQLFNDGESTRAGAQLHENSHPETTNTSNREQREQPEGSAPQRREPASRGQPKTAPNEAGQTGSQRDGTTVANAQRHDSQGGRTAPSQSQEGRAAKSQGGEGGLTGAKKVVEIIGKVFSTTLGFIANTVVIFFIGLYLASNPAKYRTGLIRLFPKQRRERAGEIVDRLGYTLWRWLLGRLLSMAIVGVLMAVALMILGIPSPILLGLLGGLLTFVPNLGAILAIIPPAILGFAQGTSTGVAVLATYLGIQMIESYVITPLVQQRQIDLPPAMIIFAQVLLGVLTGFLGVAVATPIMAASVVLVQEIYVKDALGDDIRSE